MALRNLARAARFVEYVPTIVTLNATDYTNLASRRAFAAMDGGLVSVFGAIDASPIGAPLNQAELGISLPFQPAQLFDHEGRLVGAGATVDSDGFGAAVFAEVGGVLAVLTGSFQTALPAVLVYHFSYYTEAPA